MPAISRLIVVHSDPRVAEAVRFGFEREGAQVVCVTRPGAIASALLEAEDSGLEARPDLVVAGAGDADATARLFAELRAALDTAGARAPILGLTNDLDGDQARAAGASEILPVPVFVRDVVTVGRLLAARDGRPRRAVEGQLSDYGGVFYVIRAMAALRRSAVLSLVRGLRRGELRFYRGEVTSAQVSVLHGLAALHQLLLWTRAHFELRDEDVVRRQQIPLAPEDILADAERFLGEIRSVATTLVPSAVYQTNRELVQERRSSIPRPVRRVLRLIDGHRTMGDVIEDSPYRVLETVRIANRLVETGLVRRQEAQRSQDVSIERWLADQYAELSSASIGSVELESLDGKPVRPPFADDDEDEELEGRAPSEPDAPLPDDWADVLPTEMVTGFSPVVPSTEAAGEIVSSAPPPTPADEDPPPDDDQPRRPSAGRLWKRLFTKSRPGDSATNRDEE